MKTAMEQALARIELLYGMKPDAIHWEMFKNDCMEKEKEQIIDAADKARITFGDEFDFSYEFTDGEEYYNQTYNQNK
jgi:hypothetical protein